MVAAVSPFVSGSRIEESAHRSDQEDNMSARSRTIAVFVVATLVVSCVPAFAGEPPTPKRSVATIVKWTVIGAAAGTGLGLLLGFRAYDDAPFAERKIGISMVAGGAIGLGAGLGVGYWRSAPKPERTKAAFRQWEESRTPVCLRLALPQREQTEASPQR